MKEIAMETNVIPISSVERNKAASMFCKRLFPLWSRPPTQGELQRIIIEAKELGANEEQIHQAGQWWLWIRDLAIENTFSRQSQISIMKIAAKATVGLCPVSIVSCRSPELLHAQVSGQGNLELPRSRKAIAKLGQIVTCSQRFLPTCLTIVFADLAVDNLKEIQNRCDVEDTIRRNIQQLDEICLQTGLNQSQILRMSQLTSPRGGCLSDFLAVDGVVKFNVTLDQKSQRLIEIAARESFQSHSAMFGWTKEQSLAHNLNLGITMGLVGQAIQHSISSAILIHNEAFIARGALNNLFTDSKDPLPVICLKDLLENKRKKD